MGCVWGGGVHGVGKIVEKYRVTTVNTDDVTKELVRIVHDPRVSIVSFQEMCDWRSRVSFDFQAEIRACL